MEHFYNSCIGLITGCALYAVWKLIDILYEIKKANIRLTIIDTRIDHFQQAFSERNNGGSDE